jgi:hypothetical protein
MVENPVVEGREIGPQLDGSHASCAAHIPISFFTNEGRVGTREKGFASVCWEGAEYVLYKLRWYRPHLPLQGMSMVTLPASRPIVSSVRELAGRAGGDVLEKIPLGCINPQILP